MRKIGRSGQGMVEYALIIALIALVCVFTLSGMGSGVVGSLTGNVATSLSSANASVSGS